MTTLARHAASPDDAELVRRLCKLVSLDDPANGGPYGGYAAAECMRAMREAAARLSALSAELERVTRERDEAREGGTPEVKRLLARLEAAEAQLKEKTKDA